MSNGGLGEAAVTTIVLDRAKIQEESEYSATAEGA